MNSSMSPPVVAAASAAVASPSAAAQVANIAYCYVLPAICVLGIIGNITNLITLASRRLRAVSYMYLRALAVADLLCMIFVLLFVSIEILQKQGVVFNNSRLYSFYQTHLMLTFINWALGTGVFVVVALSLERYISIVFPMHFRAWNSPQRASKAIAIAYIIPMFLYLPYAIGRYKTIEKIDPLTNKTIYSVQDSDISKVFYWQMYKWTREGMLRFGPIVALSILNVQIMLAFRKRQKMFAQLTKRKEQSHQQRDDTLLYMLGGTVFMFFICNIPAAINLIFIDEALKKRLDYQVFRAVANILEITNHASQFYVFCACSSDYRATFLRKFPCFQKSYAASTRDRFRSVVRRGQSVMTRDSREQTSEIMPAPPQQRETDTVDVQLASADEERSSDRESREYDSLLRHGLASKDSTFL